VVGPRRLDATELAGYDAGCAIAEEEAELVHGAANTSGAFSVLVISLGAHAVTSAQVMPRGPFFCFQTRLPPWHPHRTTMFRQNLSAVLSTFPRSLIRHSRRRLSYRSPTHLPDTGASSLPPITTCGPIAEGSIPLLPSPFPGGVPWFLFKAEFACLQDQRPTVPQSVSQRRV
jgi:hypothetical protein